MEASKATSFYREIQELIKFEVREAKPTVLKLLNTSKNPYARQYALEYLGNLFLEDSFDLAFGTF